MLTEIGARLIDRGYKVIPIHRGKKFPCIDDWQNAEATHDDLACWAKKYPESGIGVLCKNTIAVDVDCRNVSMVKKLAAWLEENVGIAAARIGNQPKMLFAYRGNPRKKIKSAEFECQEGNKHAVEVLADGQQFVAFGIHPDTNKPYRWLKSYASLDSVDHQDLPELTEDMARKFIDFFERKAREAGWQESRKGLDGNLNEYDELLALRPKFEAESGDVTEMLAKVDPDIDHDHWFRIGMALHHQFDGGDEGLQLWAEWSAEGEKFKDGECEKRWESFDSQGKVPVTLAYVASLAKQEEAEEVMREKVEGVLPHMLQNWSLVLVEGHARVVRDDIFQDRTVLYGLEDVRKEFQNQRVMSYEGKTPRLVNLVDMWLEHEERKTYPAGLAFSPDGESINQYNLWRGWSVEPVQGDVQPWIDFITDVIADGNVANANWIIAWCAQMVQQPQIKIGIGLVLRGLKGTGKTKFAELLGWLVKSHFTSASKAEHITGNFNKHLQETLLLCGEEAYWAGAKAAESALKDLLTASQIFVEKKGVDGYMAPNYTRIVFTSNDDFVVPATLDERRFAVFDISASRKEDSRYFESLDSWFHNGGGGALLYYLKHFDLTTVNVRKAPQTDALDEQKLENLNGVDSWLLASLQNAEFREHKIAGESLQFGEEVSKTQLYAIYASSVRGRYESVIKENSFWKALRSAGAYEEEVHKRSAGTRFRAVRLKTLKEARSRFQEYLGIDVRWTEDDRPDPLDPANWVSDEDVPF
tara:strand:+ start:674 stop:2941 length:2268 start_codon:yes stop_codon:yes gene_type:complete